MLQTLPERTTQERQVRFRDSIMHPAMAENKVAGAGSGVLLFTIK